MKYGSIHNLRKLFHTTNKIVRIAKNDLSNTQNIKTCKQQITPHAMHYFEVCLYPSYIRCYFFGFRPTFFHFYFIFHVLLLQIAVLFGWILMRSNEPLSQHCKTKSNVKLLNVKLVVFNLTAFMVVPVSHALIPIKNILT